MDFVTLRKSQASILPRFQSRPWVVQRPTRAQKSPITLKVICWGALQRSLCAAHRQDYRSPCSWIRVFPRISNNYCKPDCFCSHCWLSQEISRCPLIWRPTGLSLDNSSLKIRFNFSLTAHFIFPGFLTSEVVKSASWNDSFKCSQRV